MMKSKKSILASMCVNFLVFGGSTPVAFASVEAIVNNARTPEAPVEQSFGITVEKSGAQYMKDEGLDTKGVAPTDLWYEVDAQKRDSGAADAGKIEAGRNDAGKADAAGTEAGKSDAARADTDKADTAKLQTDRDDAGKPGAGKADTAKADDVRTEAAVDAGTGKKAEGNAAKDELPPAMLPPMIKGEAPAKLKIVRVTSPVKPGDLVTVRVVAPAKARCNVYVAASSVARKTELAPKIAGDDGKVSWTFKVSKTFKGESIPINVTSSINGRKEAIETIVPVVSVSSSMKTHGM